ncbi:ABC transporter permease (plasmid) [Deefgea piscis]|uniref:ABC transporter permease n=1 Tax=Deefgea piscis TaxID=2739061 RepID=A0A6M8SSX8_9NEIS|nr:ABC transporter permease [Deefgea piscis]QKJ68295.1 ABC transporter permease [Deefgea piscis]
MLELVKNGKPSLAQQFVESLSSLLIFRHRSLLALLGITIGCASIIALLNIGQNAADESLRTFQSMGSNTLIVNFPPSAKAKTPLPLKINVTDFQQAMPNVANIAGLTLFGAKVGYNGQSVDSSIVGTTVGLADIAGLRLAQGRFISDFDHRETFVVLGARVANALSHGVNSVLVGSLVRINDDLFTVVGILEAQPPNPLVPVVFDDAVMLPMGAMRRIHPTAELGNILVQVKEHQNSPMLQVQLQEYLTSLFPTHLVNVQAPQQLLDGLRRQGDMFTYLLAGLGCISLLVGGIGVMNVMLMSVSERRREIGVRMALGARQSDIRTLFLFEAASLSAAGALLGVLLGIISAYIFTLISAWQFTLAVEAIPIGVACSMFIGLFFGIYPAMLASRLNPVQALRDE